MNIHKNFERIKSVAMFQAIEHNCNYNIVILNPKTTSENIAAIPNLFDEEKSTYEIVNDSYFEKERPNVLKVMTTDAMQNVMSDHFDPGWTKLFEEKKREMDSIRAIVIEDDWKSTVPNLGQAMPIVNYDREPGPNIQGAVAPLVKTEPDMNRNDPCHCGSGKKYKKCCLK